jgi:hypothetical protein
MLSDYTPILFDTDRDFKSVDLYFAHDIHYANECHDNAKWKAFKKMVLAEPNRYVIFVGDCFETAILGSKSDVYSQAFPPQSQKEWFTEQLIELDGHVVALVPGNHENRITKTVGLYPLYDCAKDADIPELYRHRFAFIDIGVGDRVGTGGKQFHYVGFAAHRMKDCKAYNGSDFVDGIDFACYGHDHDAKDHARAKLVYDSKNKFVSHKNIEVINSGAFLTYGGYGAEAGYRPQTQKIYKLVLDGTRKQLQTVGFYL